MAKRILKVREGITWEEFLSEYGNFFPISYEPKRIEKLKSEYFRLTGKKAEDGKVKGTKSKARKIDTRGNEGESGLFGEGSRADSD